MQRRRVRPPVQVADSELHRCRAPPARSVTARRGLIALPGCRGRARSIWRRAGRPPARLSSRAHDDVCHASSRRPEAVLAAGYRLIAAWTGPMPQRNPIRPRGRPCAADPSALVSLARVHLLRGRSCRIRSLARSTWMLFARCWAHRPTMCTLEHFERQLTSAASCTRAHSSSRRRCR